MRHAFAVNPALEVEPLARSLAAAGHVSIPAFLDGDGAERLHAELARRGDWRWAINAGNSVYDLDRAALSELRRRFFAEDAELDRKVSAAARDGFQFRFSSLRVPDALADRRPESDLLHAFAEFMRSEAVLDLISGITAQTNICFADAQGTAYQAGDFLTGHDDAIEGKNRACAYVMGLTPEWRIEWGGLLLFHEADGRVRGLVPRFNCLNLFALPVVHSVSQVTDFAGATRYAVTGWLRTEMPQ